jgi:uncharacterized repeat protein (TIGR03803 family)
MHMKSKKHRSSFLAAFALAAITLSLAVCAQAQTENVLYDFALGWTGNYPDGTVVTDSAGNIYGSTQWGGDCCGAVYELSPTSGGGWAYKVLKGFSNSSYGAYVSPSLARDSAGNLYGTTINGGNLSASCNGEGCGVVFELSPTSSGPWTETVLHTFSGKADGGNPYGQLLIGPDGSLYGTTVRGGNDHQCTTMYVEGCGVVFKLTKGATGWKYTVLYTFTKAVGDGPNAGLAMDAAGNLYGTTQAYGGILFELTPTSSGEWTETTLINFIDTGWGEPQTGLIIDASGNLYGTTDNFGGDCPYRGPCGTVFELSPVAGGGWTQNVLHTFMAGSTDGAYPISTSFDSAGNIYGVAFYGGDTSACPGQGCGVVFELSPSSGGTWTETLLHEFTDGADGNPNGLSGVVVNAAGNIFGTAAAGGNNITNCGDGCGVIFEITP